MLPISSRPIPITNIYHMLCYAWDVLEESEITNVGWEVGTNKPVDLLTSVLINGINHLLQRGVGQQYLLHSEVLPTVRGRIQIVATERRFLLQQGKALCEFDELSVNTLPNQILKGTLYRLSLIHELDDNLKQKTGRLFRRFRQVDDIRPSAAQINKVQLHRHNKFYKFLFYICELIISESLLNEESGTYEFKDFSEKRMAWLYEKFLLNFYKKEQRKYKVSSNKMYWDATSNDDPELKYLPSMLTDITLEGKDKTIIIDAKYYTKTLSKYRGKASVRSGHLYQIMAYLNNWEYKRKDKLHAKEMKVEGMLLYPKVTEELSVSYTIKNDRIKDGHAVRVETVDLSQPWHAIEERLKELVLLERTPVQ